MACLTIHLPINYWLSTSRYTCLPDKHGGGEFLLTQECCVNTVFTVQGFNSNTICPFSSFLQSLHILHFPMSVLPFDYIKIVSGRTLKLFLSECTTCVSFTNRYCIFQKVKNSSQTQCNQVKTVDCFLHKISKRWVRFLQYIHALNGIRSVPVQWTRRKQKFCYSGKCRGNGFSGGMPAHIR